MSTIKPAVRELLEGPNFASVAMVREDGRPYNVVVWVGIDGDDVVVNSVLGRGWSRILDANPRAAVAVINAENPYEYAQISGPVSRSLDDAEAWIDRFAQKYLGEPSYPLRRPGEERVTYRVRAEEVRHWEPYTG